MKIKKKDTVIVLLGKDRGKKGKVEKVLQKKGKVIVSGVNIYKRHLKSQGEGKPGGIVDIIKPLAVSKVALICPKCSQQTKVGYKLTTEGKKRICRKCKEVIDE